MLAGVVMFETATVAHAQYSAMSDDGRKTGALDGLFSYLIDHYRPRTRWFDFGISSEQEGQVLNQGLAGQKEEFGGSAVVYDAYRLSTI
jgi:hypothetical protein